MCSLPAKDIWQSHLFARTSHKLAESLRNVTYQSALETALASGRIETTAEHGSCAIRTHLISPPFYFLHFNPLSASYILHSTCIICTFSFMQYSLSSVISTNYNFPTRLPVVMREPLIPLPVQTQKTDTLNFNLTSCSASTNKPEYVSNVTAITSLVLGCSCTIYTPSRLD